MATSQIKFLVNSEHILIYPFPLVNSLGPSVGSAGQLKNKNKNEGNPCARCYLFSSSPVSSAGLSTLTSWSTQKLQN
jgi:hypothetical protein